MIAKSFLNLKAMTVEELIAAHDVMAKTTVAEVDYFLDEIRARESAKVNHSVANLTNKIYWLTLVVTASTLVQLGIAFVMLTKSQ